MFSSLFQHVNSLPIKLVVVSAGKIFVQALSLGTSHCLVSQLSHSQLTVLVAQFLGFAAAVHHVVHTVRQYDRHLHLPSR